MLKQWKAALWMCHLRVIRGESFYRFKILKVKILACIMFFFPQHDPSWAYDWKLYFLRPFGQEKFWHPCEGPESIVAICSLLISVQGCRHEAMMWLRFELRDRERQQEKGQALKAKLCLKIVLSNYPDLCHHGSYSNGPFKSITIGSQKAFLSDMAVQHCIWKYFCRA